ncbi:uridine kinase [Bacillus spongiae]|uniref:Uridine kinase n=1 Tax=Bacillus spongiae TaxID=2683610 RepID=A0ABU8HGX3_9BACI
MSNSIVSLNNLLTKFYSLKDNQNTLIIGIDGPSAAGKSTLARKLKNLGKEVTIVHMDDFYRPSNEKKIVDSTSVGESFDWERLMKQVLLPVSNNNKGSYQRYDWDTDRLAEWHKVPVGGIVIIEGCYSLRNELLPFYHVKLWVDALKEISSVRVVDRERRGTGNKKMWEEVYRPAEEKYIELQKPYKNVDIIVDGAGEIADINQCEVKILHESDRWLNL